MIPQVSSSHYSFGKYDDIRRWSSYWYQIREILSLKPQSVLEVWAWNDVTYQYIKWRDISIDSMDIAKDLNPDIVWSVDSIPLEDNQYDVVCAFQVLEHLSYEKLEACVREMLRVSKKHIIISLPYYGPYFKCTVRVPILWEKTFLWKISYIRPKHTFRWQHYREIWKNWYSLSRIREDMSTQWTIVKEFLVKENPYHYFFILKK